MAKNTYILNYAAIVKVINKQGDKHAILVHAKRFGENLNLAETNIIDPLSEKDSKFKRKFPLSAIRFKYLVLFIQYIQEDRIKIVLHVEMHV